MEFDFSKEPGRVLEKENIVDISGMTPKMSVVTPFYNAGRFFKQTYNCLINQTLEAFEWISVNDGSTKSEDVDKILGLNIGADDYVTKPFNPLELIARVKSQLRRYTKLGTMAETAEQAVYTCGGLMVNDDLKTVTVDGEPVKLTPIEYNILLLLIKNQGKVFSIEQIYESIWNEEAIGADNTVAVHIRHIREKIEINPREPRYLKVVWGIGYKIEKM